ncbi:hypothetical protein PQZ67_gp70 [Escherichia phage ZCEC13]|nr:hypothetical protein PQZ67_gp70 [Escherichia phage ZCEC13]
MTQPSTLILNLTRGGWCDIMTPSSIVERK